MRAAQSPLAQVTWSARRPTRWWFAWLVVVVIIVVVGPLGARVGNAVLGAPNATSGWYPYVDVFTSGAILLAVFGWVQGKEARAFSTVGFRPARHAARVLWGFGFGAAGVCAVVGLGLLVGVYGVGGSTAGRTGADAVLPALPLILLALVHAAAQAALLPGYLLQTTAAQTPGWLAIVATALLVAVVDSLNPIALMNLFLVGVIAGQLAMQQGSVWLVAGANSGWLFFQSAVFGLPDGGIPAPTALLPISPLPGASTLLSGGAFGQRTGLLGTVVLAGVTVAAALLPHRSTHQPRPLTTRTLARSAPIPSRELPKGTDDEHTSRH